MNIFCSIFRERFGTCVSHASSACLSNWLRMCNLSFLESLKIEVPDLGILLSMSLKLDSLLFLVTKYLFSPLFSFYLLKHFHNIVQSIGNYYLWIFLTFQKAYKSLFHCIMKKYSCYDFITNPIAFVLTPPPPPVSILFQC